MEQRANCPWRAASPAPTRRRQKTLATRGRSLHCGRSLLRGSKAQGIRILVKVRRAHLSGPRSLYTHPWTIKGLSSHALEGPRRTQANSSHLSETQGQPDTSSGKHSLHKVKQTLVTHTTQAWVCPPSAGAPKEYNTHSGRRVLRSGGPNHSKSSVFLRLLDRLIAT